MEHGRFNVLWVVLFSLACCFPFTAADEEIINNDTIRTLIKAGFSPFVIISKIRASMCNFDISTNEPKPASKSIVLKNIKGELGRKSVSSMGISNLNPKE